MDATVLVALITGGFSFFGALIASAFANSKTLYRIDQLEEKMTVHNNAIIRLTQAEVEIKNIKEKVK